MIGGGKEEKSTVSVQNMRKTAYRDGLFCNGK